MAYASYDDIVTSAIGVDFDGISSAQVEALIAKATLRLLTEIPTITARVAAGALSDQLVSSVVQDMVVRVLQNPQGLRSVSIDDYQATVDRTLSSGQIYVTEAERALLSPGPTRQCRVGSLRISIPAWRVPNA